MKKILILFLFALTTLNSFSQATAITDKSAAGVNYTYTTATLADTTGIPYSTHFYDIATESPYYRDAVGGVINLANGAVNSLPFSLSSAQILAMNTTPIIIVNAPGSGYAIQVVSGAGKMNFLTGVYATSTTIGLCTSTAALCQYTNANLLGSATSIVQTIGTLVVGAGTQLVDNQPLTITSLISDPTAGGGSFDGYVLYRLIKL